MSMPPLTAGWLAEAAGGRLLCGDADIAVGEISTDTRRLSAGDFFVALRGPRFDGHGFIGTARAAGAIGALVDATYGGERWGALVQVQDTTVGLQELAHAVRRASGARVVAITGSAGKTTTKDATAALLATTCRVVKNHGNLNNHIGLPLSLLQLRTSPDVAVMELGMNHAGEISRLVAIAEPDARVWTNVGDAHLGFFASLDAIADAKAEILEGADAGTCLVCNADDLRVMTRAAGFSGRTVTFGLAPSATVRAVDIDDRGVSGTRARVLTPAGEAAIETSLIGRGNLMNVLAAIATALEFGVPLARVPDVVAGIVPADHRGVVHRLPGGVTVIDDSYNASPSAVRLALETVAGEAHARRRIAVLGEMLELGDQARAMHEACGRAAAAARLDRLVTVGGVPALAMASAAVAAGLPASAVDHVASSAEAAVLLEGNLQAGDLVLVKGSRGIGTDLVVSRLIGGQG
ncbi:MAG: UDP-N-acetylmuramoyl-tripeptide--D-alanyl-D-alanine ligase [Vicinamibacterales bacterium]